MTSRQERNISFSSFIPQRLMGLDPKLCRGLANSGVFAPESGLGSVDLPNSKTPDGPSKAGGPQNSRLVIEKA